MTMEPARYHTVYACAVEVFGTANMAPMRLAAPWRAIVGQAQEALLANDEGFKTVLELLGRIEHDLLG